MSLRILRPGLLTTVQDLGRFGYQQDGIIVSGAMDAQALRVANLLVGNPETAAGLEITLLGPRIRFEADHFMALTGAHLSPTLNGQPVADNRAVWVAAGTELAFGPAVAGCRSYLAVAGGVAVPLVLGSRSTYLRASFGGHEGRALRAGDVLPVGKPSTIGSGLMQLLEQPKAAWTAASFTPGPALCPRPPYRPVLRAVRGPEYGQFSAESQQAFWQEPFTITPAADRMGYRLSGPPLMRHEEAELLSSAVTFGTVQVPAGGQPIVLGADHQTTGGYPRLALVISVDWPALAQAAPGQQLRFREVSVREAQALVAAREQAVAGLRRGMETVFGR
ncbi:biotin-dependent carboxyltransferase family protein [Hymenobacter sp. DH14]|uniref:Biotin-dependent carboxyltransferase family protein n=1 Tax=Hymenobacter cyanobacteriorum TaxID=2926463 RepID=A0A9X2AIJ4_9BACT|nr:biotin-dependent carboxyltransferase family protein [Hymenobacter cyanobacteriorum]MCI1187839.1 biotin-dependent carboxyltransferase family protein [Hymenobacter cyanobacteriorum]